MRRTALLAASALLTLTACSGGTADTAAPVNETASGSPSPTASASVESTTLPWEAPPRAPRLRGAVEQTDASAERFARYAVRTFYHSVAVRDLEPLQAISGPARDCTGCADTAKVIADLEQRKEYQLPGDIEFRRVGVTAKEGARRVVQSVLDVGAGTLVAGDGRRGTVKPQRAVEFQTLLAWRDKAQTWVVLDYSIASTR
ncbi:hypothetical protein GCM10027425_03400 [Alteromonas gracilis]